MNRKGRGVAVMANTIADIPEIMAYHLVAAAPDDDIA